MEKKTMGALIAALRKASGMTQKELAERLHVSDKAVSRWEREESAPDLSVIPALAETLGVTADELLRGERIPADAPESPAGQARMAAQLANAVSRVRLHHGICATLSITASMLGLLTALICNNAFQRATLGFFLSCIFDLGALVCIGISGVLAIHHLCGYSADDPICLSARKFSIFLSILTALIDLGFFFFTLPLLTLSWDAYMGLSGDTWLAEGGAYLLVYLLLVLAVCGGIAWKHKYDTSAPFRASLPRLRRLAGKCLAITLAIELLIGLGSSLFFSLTSVSSFAKGEEFDNFEEFRAHIEQDFPEQDIPEPAPAAPEPNVSVGLQTEILYPNEDGIYEHPDLNEDGGHIREKIYGKDSKVLCTYRNPRDAIVCFQVNEDETEVLRFWVYERIDWFAAESLWQSIASLFGIAAVTVGIGGACVYIWKRKRVLREAEKEDC